MERTMPTKQQQGRRPRGKSEARKQASRSAPEAGFPGPDLLANLRAEGPEWVARFDQAVARYFEGLEASEAYSSLGHRAHIRGKWGAYALRLWAWFELRQRRARRWISVEVIVDYYVREKVGIGASPEAEERLRQEAYSRLIDAMRAGVFEQHGRSRALRFASSVGADGQLRGERPRVLSWLTANQLQDHLQLYRADLDVVCQYVLNFCWLPQECVRQWLGDHGLTAPSYWFQLPQGSGDQAVPSVPRLNQRLRETTRQRLKRALIDLHDEGIDIRSPDSVDVLQKQAVERAKVRTSISKSTFERALSDARKEIAERDAS
jgi:hypothetical protein